MCSALNIVVSMLESRIGKREAHQMICILLLLFGVSRKNIQERIGASHTTLCKYSQFINSDKISELFDANLYRPVSELEKFSEQIEKDFEANPPKTRAEAKERIKKLTGIERSLSQVGKFLKKKGFNARAVGFLPSKVSIEAQKDFLTDKLLPAIQAAKAGIIELFFMDASHFVQGGVPSRVWSKVRMWVKTGSGRKRFNVLGALNFISKKIETISNDAYITSTSVVLMLEKLAENYAGRPIKIILDNARYQKCKLVMDKATELKIELLFLPTYSPNLNLIERVWKFVKTKVLGAAYIETFTEYCQTISNFIDTISTENANKMDSLVSDKFQLFDKCQTLNNSSL